jgi:hypothetical protein
MSTGNTLPSYLINLDACREAQTWAAAYVDAQTAWDACERGDWLLWILARTGVDVRETLDIIVDRVRRSAAAAAAEAAYAYANAARAANAAARAADYADDAARADAYTARQRAWCAELCTIAGLVRARHACPLIAKTERST